MNSSFSEENPLSKSYVQIIIPELANEIGLNEAIVVHQIHYWLNKCSKVIDGNNWIYNSFESWHQQFGYWSLSKIKRVFFSLEQNGYLISKKMNSKNYDQTKWYTLDYSKLSKFFKIDELPIPTMSFNEDTRLSQNESIYKETKNTSKNNLNTLSIEKNNNENIISENYEVEREMIKIWNEVFNNNQEVMKFTHDKIALLKESKNFFSLDLNSWRGYCEKIFSCKFLMGESKNSTFKASIYWATQITNIRKVLEGAYILGDRKSVIYANNPEITEELAETNLNPIWIKVKEKLNIHLGKDTVKSWINKLEFEISDQNTVTLNAPSNFIKQYIEERFQYKIIKAFCEIGIELKGLIIGIRSCG